MTFQLSAGHLLEGMPGIRFQFARMGLIFVAPAPGIALCGVVNRLYIAVYELAIGQIAIIGCRSKGAERAFRRAVRKRVVRAPRR